MVVSGVRSSCETSETNCRCTLGELLQLVELALQAGGHLVEGGGQAGEVVHAADLHPLVQASGRQPLGGLRGVPDRQDHLAGDQRGDRGQQQHDAHADADQTRWTSAEGLLLLVSGNDVVQLVEAVERSPTAAGAECRRS